MRAGKRWKCRERRQIVEVLLLDSDAAPPGLAGRTAGFSMVDECDGGGAAHALQRPERKD